MINLKKDIQLSDQVLKQGTSDYKDTVPTAIPHCLVHVLFKVTRIMTVYVFINTLPQSEVKSSPCT